MRGRLGSHLHLIHSHFFSMSGYQIFGMWVLAFLLLAIAAIKAQDPWNYSEADLRIAEKLAIPYYRRHPGDYPDIDIASMMRDRGLTLRPYNNNRQIVTPVRQSNHMQSAYDGFRKSILQKSLGNRLEKPSRYTKKSYSDKYNKYGNKQKKQGYWWKF